MKVLVDTHTFIWALLHDHRLTPKAKGILRSDEHELVFSLASLWEIAIKIKTGKLHTIGSSVAYIRDEMKAYGMDSSPSATSTSSISNPFRTTIATPSTASSSPRPSPNPSPSSPPTAHSASTA